MAFVGLVLCMSFAAMSRSDDTPAKRSNDSVYEATVSLIKKYETLHQPRNWPYVGYGHRVLPGERFPRNKAVSPGLAETILRRDLDKNTAYFREFGKDSLLLGVLAYNIGSGAVMRSSIVKKLRAGDRNIYNEYVSHCRYNGKVHAGLRKRREEEFALLYQADKDVAQVTDGASRDTVYIYAETKTTSVK